MRLTKENISRRIDHLGRISIPKNIRARMCIEDNSLLDCFSLEDDDGNLYVCLTQHQEEEKKAARVAQELVELGIEIPEALEKML